MDTAVFASLSNDDLTRLRDELVNALAQGASRIRFDNRDVEFRSTQDMQGQIKAMNGELTRRNAPASPRRIRSFRLVGRGGYS